MTEPKKRGRGRPRGSGAGVKMGHHHRGKIQIALLINRLHDIGLGKVEGSQVSVNAAIALLRKALPDLQAHQIGGDAENPITVRTIVTGVRRAGE
jgi:hypothetical protein